MDSLDYLCTDIDELVLLASNPIEEAILQCMLYDSIVYFESLDR